MERDPQVMQASMHYVTMLLQQYFNLLPTSMIQDYQCSPLNNITLLGALDLDRINWTN
jgi:hypothetical protein